MPGHRVVFVTDRPKIHRDLALDAAPPGLEVEMLASPAKQALIQSMAGAEFLISERAGSIDSEVIDTSPQLRLIQRLGSQCHDIDLDAASASGIPVCTWPLAQSAMVAEHVMLQVLSLAKRLRDSMATMTTNENWGEPQRSDANTFAMNWSGRTGIVMLIGMTVGIVGMGEIGTELATRLRSFGCDVVYNKRTRLPAAAEARLGIRYAPLDDLLGQCQVVCLLVPHSDDTTGMTDRQFLSKMLPHALLVSCGASTTLDEEAVAAAYKSGHLGGVATDGHRWEPAHPDGPLVSLAKDPTANVVLTPHSAQGDIELTAAMRRPEYTNLMSVLGGNPLLHRVN